MMDVERIPAAEEIERIDALIEREKEAHRGAAGRRFMRSLQVRREALMTRARKELANEPEKLKALEEAGRKNEPCYYDQETV